MTCVKGKYQFRTTEEKCHVKNTCVKLGKIAAQTSKNPPPPHTWV